MNYFNIVVLFLDNFVQVWDDVGTTLITFPTWDTLQTPQICSTVTPINCYLIIMASHPKLKQVDNLLPIFKSSVGNPPPSTKRKKTAVSLGLVKMDHYAREQCVLNVKQYFVVKDSESLVATVQNYPTT